MGTLIAILKLLPVLIAVVRTIEHEMPVSQSGQQKLDLIVGIAGDVHDASSDFQKEMPRERLIAIIVSVVGRIVGTMNALGVFRKG